ncbi:hypothetical protein AMECASPLE_005964, partial [Ameca splendens]
KRKTECGRLDLRKPDSNSYSDLKAKFKLVSWVCSFCASTLGEKEEETCRLLRKGKDARGSKGKVEMLPEGLTQSRQNIYTGGTRVAFHRGKNKNKKIRGYSLISFLCKQ